MDWGLAVEREAVIRPLVEQQNLTPDDVERAVRHLRVSRSLLYTLVRRYRQLPRASSLLPWKRGRDTHSTFLEQNREQLLKACIQEFYLRSERPSMAALIREVRRRFSEQKLSVPNYRAVRRRVEAMDLRLVIGRREGAKRACEKLGPVHVSPLEVIQIDRSPVEVIVVDQRSRLPIGRPVWAASQKH